ncbi:MAG: hypothetical protein OEL80_01925 [Desulfuromonadales bacterium]|nr:hypothetical protein [Desulfuromonadales bacterium]
MKTPAGKLNIRRIVAARWGDGVDAAARRTLADKSGQVEAGSAALADGLQASAGERLIAQCPAMCLVDEFNECPAFGKRASTAALI